MKLRTRTQFSYLDSPILALLATHIEADDMNTHTYNPSHPVYCACNAVPVIRTNEEKLAALQAEFPTLGLSFGYIGNYYGTRGTPAFRDDTSWRVFTNQTYTTRGLDGHSFSVEMPRGELDYDKARRLLRDALASGRITKRVYS